MTGLSPAATARMRARRVPDGAKCLTVELVQGSADLIRSAVAEIDAALNCTAAASPYTGSDYPVQAQAVDWTREAIDLNRSELLRAAKVLDQASLQMRDIRTRRKEASA